MPPLIAGVARSTTELANVIPRIFMDDTDEDRKAIQPLIYQVVAYPLSQFDGKMKMIDWATVPDIPKPGPTSDGETKWVVPDRFFDANQFGAVLDTVPPLPGEEAMHAQFRALMTAAEMDPPAGRGHRRDHACAEQPASLRLYDCGANIDGISRRRTCRRQSRIIVHVFF